jgi:hypothetical protein
MWAQIGVEVRSKSIAPIMISRMLRGGFVLLAIGCSGGNTNVDGASDRSNTDVCETISTEYQTALMKAEECTVGTAHQCAHAGIASFFCQCHVVVNGDGADLAAISGRYDAAGCMHGCIGICIDEKVATCQADPTSSTGGRCLPVQPDGGP